MRIDLDPLPAFVDLEKALADVVATVHDDVPRHLAAHVWQGRGDYPARALAPSTSSDAPSLRSRRVDHIKPGHSRQLGRARQSDDNMRHPSGAVFFRNGIAGMLGFSDGRCG